MTFRILLFITIVCLAAAGPWYLFIATLAWYTVWYLGLETFIPALIADSYFLIIPDTYPWYTIAVAVLMIVLLLLRPHMSMYNQE